MNKIKRNIPNAITCGNLLCGCLALVKAFEGDLVWAAYLVGIACVFDFFDGFMARLLGVSSPIGKDLDSLADMVTFGVVPGVVSYSIILYGIHLGVEIPTANEYGRGQWTYFHSENWALLGFLITILSAVRLAKFNNDSRQADSFIGLPTPANAIFFCSMPLIMNQITSEASADKNPFVTLADISGNPLLALLSNPWIIITITIVFSLLLVSELPLFSLKFKSFGWKGNEIRFVFLGLAVVMLALLQFIGIPLVIILYILMSVVNNFMSRSKKSVE